MRKLLDKIYYKMCCLYAKMYLDRVLKNKPVSIKDTKLYATCIKHIIRVNMEELI